MCRLTYFNEHAVNKLMNGTVVDLCTLNKYINMILYGAVSICYFDFYDAISYPMCFRLLLISNLVKFKLIKRTKFCYLKNNLIRFATCGRPAHCPVLDPARQWHPIEGAKSPHELLFSCLDFFCIVHFNTKHFNSRWLQLLYI